MSDDIDLTELFFCRKTLVNPKGYVWNPERLRLIRDVTWICPVSINGKWESQDGLLVIEDFTWTFRVPFTWNGATAVSSGKVDNTPNLPVVSETDQPIYELWFPTLIHDAGCGYVKDPTFPFTRKEVDWFFYITMKQRDFKHSTLYYYGVKWLGTTAYYFKKWLISLFKKK